MQPNEKKMRKYPRAQFKRPVAIICKGVAEVSQGVEIGEGGVSFETDLVLDAGSQVVVNFYIPKGGFFCLKAEVKNTIPKNKASHANTTVYGLSFTEVSLSLKRQIRAYVARMSH